MHTFTNSVADCHVQAHRHVHNREHRVRSNDRYDAVVVGGGPGGSAAASHLASGGARVLLVEKATYPREKPCGDGLTPRGTAALDEMGLTDAYAHWPRSVGLRLHGAGGAWEMPWPDVEGVPSFGLTCPRTDLDHLLARHAVASGADLVTATTATRPLLDDDGRVNGVELRPDGQDPYDVRADVVVAADGASSRIGQALDHPRDPSRPIAVAIRQYFRTDRDDDPYLDSYLELWRGRELLPGYGWVFPMGGGRVNVGFGLLDSSRHFRRTNYRQQLRDWAPTAARHWGFDPGDPDGPPRSSPIPLAANRHPAHHRGVLFVGDAAGMVNPFNGEGIPYAMETGQMAAESALAMLRDGSRAHLDAYPDALARRYGSYFALGRLFVKLVGSPRVMRLATRQLPRRRLMDGVVRLLSGIYAPVGGTTSDRVIQAMTGLAPVR